MKYARRRDAVEKAIIGVLRGAGCSVQQLDGKGCPDLLVGWQDEDGNCGRLVLLEAKDPVDGKTNSRSGTKRGASSKPPTNPLGLRDSQWEWFRNWRGPKPFVVSTPDEALDAVFPERKRSA